MIVFDDKYKLRDFGFEIEEGHEYSAAPMIVNKTMKIPGRDSLWDFGSEVGERSFSFPIATNERDLSVLQQKINRLTSFLFDEFGKPREIKMILEYEKDKFYTVKVSESFSPHRIKPFAKFVLPLVASDGRKYSNYLSEEVKWGSDVITFEYNYLLGHEGLGGEVKITSPQEVNLTVEGLAVSPVFEFSGSANNLKFSANGYEFTVPNFTNTKWIIDFQKYVVFRDGQETMIEIRDFVLMPGNNAVKITGSNINIDLRVKYRDKFN